MADPIGRLTRRDVQLFLEVDEGFLVELEREAIVVCDAEGCYEPEAIERIRLCHTLHDDLGLNMPGLEVALHLIERIHAERAQFRGVLEWLRRQGDAEDEDQE